jgi:cation diffusion facilitator CzcD-associated flavoprotein CzcO
MSDWIVIGAGPAGIAAVGQLLDNKQDVVWIDESFEVGNFSKWRNVPSNTRVELFVRFLTACKSFGNHPQHELFELPPDSNCQLKYIIEPLMDVTDNLKSQIPTIKGKVVDLEEGEGGWQVTMQNKAVYFAKNIIMASGGTYKIENNEFIKRPKMIPLEVALDSEKCREAFVEEDKVAVVGSSHSAMLVVKNLIELPVKKVTNVYRSPFCFAVKFEDHTLYDDKGLKGEVAEWTKTMVIGKKIPNLVRSTFTENVKFCDKIVVATGFIPKRIRVKEFMYSENAKLTYDTRTGIIAPGLFGCGMAFPETYTDRYGHNDSRIGLWKFMDYLQRVMPIWLRYAL